MKNSVFTGKENQVASTFSPGVPEISANYFLKPGYQSRPQPQYFEDTVHDGKTWQPDVYPLAAEIARRLGARRIIDVGCGRAHKLAQLQGEFETIGVDFGSNLEFCRRQYAQGSWIEADFERSGSLPVLTEAATDAVVICADVIEHMMKPEALLEKIRHLLEHALVAVISTPERDLNWGLAHAGPPPNPSHTREWNLVEFAEFLRDAGLSVEFIGVTRSHDHDPARKTILAVVGNHHLLHLTRFAGKDFSETNGTREKFQNWLAELNGDLPAATPKISTPENRLLQVGAKSVRPVLPKRLNFALLTHNALDYTKLCLESLKKTTPLPYNIFVVDNLSSDDTPNWLAAQNDPDLHYEISPVNLGVPGGRNRLIQNILPHLPDDGFIVFFDNDLEMLPGWFEHFFELLETHPEIGIAGKIGHDILVHAETRELLQSAITIPTSVDVASGGFACWIRAATIKAVGLFDEKLGLFWHEDDDYSVRAVAAGWEVYGVPLAPIIHHEHKSGAATPGAVARGGSPENLRYLVEKWRQLGYVDADGRIIHPARKTLSAAQFQANTIHRTFSRPVTIGVDGRTFYLTDSTSRGIGHYAFHHLKSAAQMRPDWRFLIYIEEDKLSSTMERLVTLPNVRVKLLDDFRPEEIDLFHVTDPMNFSTGFDSPARLCPGRPSTAIFYDVTPLRFYWNGFSEPHRQAYLARLEQFRRRGVTMLAISEFTRQDLLKASPMPPEKVVSIMAGLNRPEKETEITAALVAEVRAKYGITRPFFLHVGALDPHKNFTGVLQAMDRIRVSGGVQLVVVGQKEHFLKATADRCAQLKLNNLVFPGYIPRLDLEVLYHETIALLFLSHYEGFGFPVLEAMAQGCPVVTTNVTSIPEVAGDAALMFAPDDHAAIARGMQQLHDSRSLRESLRIKGRAQAAKFPWTKPAQKTIAVWEQILGLARPDAPALQEEQNVEISAQKSAPKISSGNIASGGAVEKSVHPPELVWFASWQNPSGYGSEALALAQALAPSVPLQLVDAAKLKSPAFVEGLPAAAKQLLKNHLQPSVNPAKKICLSHFPATSFTPLPGAAWNIGRTMFETDRLPANWVANCNRMDEIWVPSRFNLETFVQSGVKREKIQIIPGAVDPEQFDPASCTPLPLANRAAFNFLAVFEWTFRKGWDVLLAAYLREFSAADDVCLYLRTYLMNQPDTDPETAIRRLIDENAATLNLGNKVLPRIEILARQIPGADLPRLYKAVDCLVAPSRGEGWGRPHHEAMLMELPVIATNWSGNTEFMDAENSLPLEFKIVDVKVGPELRQYQGHRWAEPSETHLRTLMRRVQQNPDQAREIGRRARTSVGEKFSPSAVAQKIQQRLAVIQQGLLTSIQPDDSRREPAVRVNWEGSFLDHGSLSHVNRELTGALKNSAGIKINCVSNAPITSAAASVWPELSREMTTTPTDVDITVRHAWPPNWTRPSRGKLAVIQPWEFGALPDEWVQQARNVDEFWVPTNFVRNCYLESGVPMQKVFVVPNGIDAEKFHPQIAPMKLTTQKKFKFLFVGGTIGRKGPDLLLQAYLKNFTAADDVCLVIKDFGGQSFYAGQTFEVQIRIAQSLPNAPEILYLNEELPPESLPTLYAACDCFVLPYRGEGFGLPVLEAMACGLPVIVTAGGATDDFVRDEFAYRIPAERKIFGNEVSGKKLAGAGWLLEPDLAALGEKMRRVFSHPSEAHERGKLASRHAYEFFSWKNSANIVAQRIRELAVNQNISAKSIPAKNAGAKILPSVALIGQLGEARKLFGQKKNQAAWDATLGAITKRPFHPEAFLLLAEIALVAGDPAIARQCAQRARDFAPGWNAPKQFLNKPLKGNAKIEWLKLPPTLNPQLSTQNLNLSVCLIVKNEEKFLVQCLKSVRGLAQQIIVVDTGSTDRTVEIAKEFGAEIYSFVWNDNFADARNAALEHATGDWILMLDADEESPAEQHPRLLADMKKSGALALRLPLLNRGNEAAGHSFVPRLFRNMPGIFYSGRVHEQIFPSLVPHSKAWGLEIGFGTAELLHHGYTKEMLRDRNKIERNLNLLREAVAENPSDANLMMNFGLELVRSENLAAGIEKYREAFRLMSAQKVDEFVPELREVLLTQFTSQLYKIRAHEEVVRVFDSPLAKNGMTASHHFALSLSLFELKQFGTAAGQMRECIAKRSRPVFSPINTDIHTAAPNHCLALSLAKSGDAAGAEKAFQIALTEKGRLDDVRLDYAKFLAGQNRAVEAFHKLNELVAANSRNVAAWRLGGEIALTRAEFLEFAHDWTGEAMRYVAEDFLVSTQRAEVLMLGAETMAAMELWERLWNSERQPNILAALILCELLEARTKHSPDKIVDELATSRAFIKWYQRLIAMRANAVVGRINSQLEKLSATLPTASQMLEKALAF